MGLSPGTRLGVYEVTGTLGVGGMGEVYRARDTRLGRQVALKVLPDAVAADPDRVQRFEREAKVLASLNHPHIAGLYGLEQLAPGEGSASPASVLVMELVEGDTLADRLRRGPLPVGEALEIARQIADALDAAHEQGIVHRDLKPANVKVGGSDDAPNVKVLDFGLAKATDGPSADAGVTNSPTLSMMATQAGFIMGTAGYMSPEQAKGARVDRRSDVFSFGVVLYEMLTGRPPFGGETAAEVMASVMIREADFSALPANLAPRLGDLLKRCLDKNPKKRWQSMGDLRVEIETIAAAPYQAVPHAVVPPRLPLWKRALPVLAASAATAIVTAIVTTRSSDQPPSPAQVVRFPLMVNGLLVNNRTVAMSPDGTRLAYVATIDGGVALMLRDLADPEARPLASGNLNRPVFSPDGQAIAFSAGQEVRRVPVTGGSPTTIVKRPGPGPLDITWTGDWVVLSQRDGITRVPASGGDPELLRAPEGGELLAAGQLLDNQGSLLFARLLDPTDDTWDTAEVVLRKPDGTEHVLVEAANNPRIAHTGHLLFTRSGTLMAIPVDLVAGRVTGRAVPMIEGVARSQVPRVAQFSVSDTGTLAYVPGPAVAIAARRLGLVDNGTVQALPVPPDSYEHPRISPDGRYVAVATDDGKQAAVWIYELGGQGPPRRLTFEGRNLAPIWSPDSHFVTYQSDREGDRGLFRQRADGTGTAERLTKAEPGTEHIPDAWTPDGKVLALRVVRGNASALWRFTAGAASSLKGLIERETGRVGAAAFSPDGRWLAYGTEGTEGAGVFVEPFPPTGARFQVGSPGYAPVWSPQGGRLFSTLAAIVEGVDVRLEGGFSAGQPRRYDVAGAAWSIPTLRNFDVMPDGKRFLVILPPGGEDGTTASQTTPPINVVLNWHEELKARAPRQ